MMIIPYEVQVMQRLKKIEFLINFSHLHAVLISFIPFRSLSSTWLSGIWSAFIYFEIN